MAFVLIYTLIALTVDVTDYGTSTLGSSLIALIKTIIIIVSFDYLPSALAKYSSTANVNIGPHSVLLHTMIKHIIV